ncbi:MAG: response regulator [Acidobacteriota bacterium]
MHHPEGRVTVVVAEDDFLVSREIVRTVEAAGFVVVGTARDGEEAVDLVARLSPSAVLLDIEMPRLNGLDAARRIRDEHPVPVVMLTAYESPDFLRAASEAGVAAYLTKPPEVATLLRAVEIAVARHADLVELRRLNAALQRALDEVKTLRGILPICSGCKKIRDDAGAWQPVDVYVIKHTDAQFTHGLCPDCIRIFYPDVASEVIGPDGSPTPTR